MWQILIVSIIGVAVVLERVFWWTGRWMRRDPKRIEKVFTAIETGDVTEASRLSRGSRDPVLRMMWNGLNHQHASLQGALQVAAGIEIDLQDTGGAEGGIEGTRIGETEKDVVGVGAVGGGRRCRTEHGDLAVG